MDSTSAWIFFAASSLTLIAATGQFLSRSADLLGGLGLVAALARPPVADRGLDRVLGEHRTVDLHRRELQLLDDLAVLDRERLVDGLPFDELGDVARARDRAAAAEGLELGVL